MFRKVASLSIAFIVASGVMIAVPANAAVKISNGVACKKSGASKKTSLGTYKCTKNPLVSRKKLTWLSVECLKSANEAVKLQKLAAVTSADFKAKLMIIETGISAQLTKKVQFQAKLDKSIAGLTEAKIQLTRVEEKLLAATTELDKKSLNSAVTLRKSAITSWTSASSNYETKIRTIDTTLKNLNASKLIATTKPVELAAEVGNTRSSAKLICSKGL